MPRYGTSVLCGLLGLLVCTSADAKDAAEQAQEHQGKLPVFMAPKKKPEANKEETPKKEDANAAATPAQPAGRTDLAGGTDQMQTAVKVIKPEMLPAPPPSEIPICRAKAIWQCQDCGWVESTEALSRKTDAEHDAGTFKCPDCGSGRVTQVPECISALRWKAISGNLVLNSSFEEGKWWPYHWEPTDRLGVFWAEGGTDGKRCIKINTNLVEAQWLPFNAAIITNIRKLEERTNNGAQKLAQCPLPTPPAPGPTTAPYYDTVAGLHGIHYKGPFFRCEPGAIYRVTVDARATTIEGGPGAKIWFKGFVDETLKTTEGVQTIKRELYKREISLNGLGAEWQRFSWVAHVAKSKSTWDGKRVQPTWLQPQLYAYWSPGTYWWDNLKVDIIGYEEFEVRTFEKGVTPVIKEPPKRMEGDFPVF